MRTAIVVACTGYAISLQAPPIIGLILVVGMVCAVKSDFREAFGGEK